MLPFNVHVSTCIKLMANILPKIDRGERFSCRPRNISRYTTPPLQLCNTICNYIAFSEQLHCVLYNVQYRYSVVILVVTT